MEFTFYGNLGAVAYRMNELLTRGYERKLNTVERVGHISFLHSQVGGGLAEGRQ